MKTKQSDNTLQKLNSILSTSSETFMLIALIGLFALPFVIAKNLEPVVKETEATALLTSTPVVDSNSQIIYSNLEDSNDVLGAQTSVKPLIINEVSKNRERFDKFTPILSDTNYSLRLTTKQVLEDIAIFTLKNETSTSQSYNFSVKDARYNPRNKKSLYVNASEYKIDSNNSQNTLTVEAGSEVTFYLTTSLKEQVDLTIDVGVS